MGVAVKWKLLCRIYKGREGGERETGNTLMEQGNNGGRRKGREEKKE